MRKPTYHYSDERWTDDQKVCLQVLAEAFCGYHHLPPIRDCGQTGVVIATFRDLSTFDGDLLTRLVVRAHVYRVRIEVSPCNGSYLKIYAHRRCASGGVCERHPGIEDLKLNLP